MAAADARAKAEFENDRMRRELAEMHARLDELERLLLRSQEQTGALKVYSVLQCVAVCCSVLQCVAVCCRVLRCVAVCCSELQ